MNKCEFGKRSREYANLFGQPVKDMDKDELLAVIGFLVREKSEKAGRHLCLS